MTLDQILQRQSEINLRMTAIRKEADDKTVAVERLEELTAEAEKLTQERNDLHREALKIRTNAKFNPVLPLNENDVEERCEDPYNTLEYRAAVKDFILRGAISPALRANESTKTGDVKSLIVPTVITDKLFERNPNAGSIFARVTKTNYPAGMSIETSNFRPKLEWVAENGKTDRKKLSTNPSITFGAFKAQIRVATSLETRTMSLPAFEQMLFERIQEAIDLGLDEVILVGSGIGQPKGILTSASYENTKKAMIMNTKQIGDYKKWLEAWSKVPLKHQSKANLVINKTDWQAHVVGMKDNNGRVVALETIGFGGKIQYIYDGREVIIVEDQGLKEFDTIVGATTASKDTAFAFFFDLKDYDFNTNMQIALRKYIDEESDEEITKVTLLADGKIISDESLVVICKGLDA